MKKPSKTKFKKLKTLKDEEIDFSDIPSLGPTFFKRAKLRLPESKTLITIRLDPDILTWFKNKGKKYQTKINAVLRMYMEAQTRSRTTS